MSFVTVYEQFPFSTYDSNDTLESNSIIVFEYAKNCNKDDQLVHLVYDRKRDLKDFDLQDKILEKINKQKEILIEK